ncbi:MAG: hypothetical protein WA021_03195 [Minisyncoccia bacterium]
MKPVSFAALSAAVIALVVAVQAGTFNSAVQMPFESSAQIAQR